MAILTTLPAQSFGINMFINIWIKDFQTSRIYLSLVWLIASAISGICVMFNGCMIDKFGVTKCLRIIYPLYIICVWLVHTTHDIVQLSVLICLMRALGPESIGTISYISICQWFKKNRGKVFSFLALLDCIFMAAPSVINLLIIHYGWRKTYMFMAIFVSVMLIPSIFFIKNKNSIENETENTVSSFNLKMFAHLILNNFIFSIFWSAQNIHALDYFSTLNSTQVANLIYIPITFGIVMGSLIGGRVLDKCNNKRKVILLATTHIILALIIFWSIHVTSNDALFYGLCYGILCGCNFTCYSVVYPSLFGTQDLGKIQSFNNGIIMFATGSGPLIFGFFKLWLSSYYWCSCGVSILLGLSSVVLIIKNI